MIGQVNSGGSIVSAMDFEVDEEDYDDDGSYMAGDDSLDDDSSIPDQVSYNALNSSTESISKASMRSVNGANSRMMGIGQQQTQQSTHMNSQQQDLAVKKRKKKAASIRQQSFQPSQINNTNNGNLSLPRIS